MLIHMKNIKQELLHTQVKNITIVNIYFIINKMYILNSIL